MEIIIQERAVNLLMKTSYCDLRRLVARRELNYKQKTAIDLTGTLAGNHKHFGKNNWDRYSRKSTTGTFLASYTHL